MYKEFYWVSVIYSSASSFLTLVLEGDDSDDESDGSVCSDETVDQQVNFIDVAKRPSTVQCDYHPNKQLDEASITWFVNGTQHTGNLIFKAVQDDDFEAFVNIGNLYRVLPGKNNFNPNLLSQILLKDRPEMLDQLIRWTGCGIDLKVMVKEGEQGALPSDGRNKIYLGLSVHGKKRADLAKKNDPNAIDTSMPSDFPLLWRASRDGSKNIIDYLSGDRPLAAYRFYLSSNSDEHAKRLRRTADLDKVLPEWLGWMISPLGESPLTAAIIGKQFKTAKRLFSKQPRLLSSALHERSVLRSKILCIY